MHPADELAYEQNYRDADPLNLDGSAMVDPQVALDMKFDAFLAEFTRKADFYRKSADEAPEWKKKIFPGGYEAVVVKIELAEKLLPAGFYDAAEFALNDAIEGFDYMNERIQDWATD